MDAVLSDDTGRFIEVAGDWLAKEPVENNVLLTWLASPETARQAKGGAIYGWVNDGGELVGALLRQRPPRAASMTSMPDQAVAELAREFSARGITMPGIKGPVGPVVRFADLWQELTGQRVGVTRSLMVHRLDEVKLSEWPPGRMRLAAPDEVDLMVTWMAHIMSAAGMASEAVARVQVEDLHAGGRLYVWDVDGAPVAVIGHAEPVNGVARISGGYVPPEYRTSWYGTALHAALCAHLIGRGCLACVGIIDASNPQSAAALRMTGYRPVLELAEYRFETGR